MSEMETGYAGGSVIETKEAKRGDVPVGIIEGYIATWDADTGGIFGVPDKFHPGAFLRSIVDHKERGNRPIRLKDHHGRTIGGFPIETVREDDVGLFGIGEINLETQFGREAYSLAKQLVLTDLSLGYSAVQDKIEAGIRHIYEAVVWEGSIVDEPANQNARITEIKAVVPFQDLPLGDREKPWSAASAMKRVRKLMSSEEKPGSGYRKAFVIFDRENAGDFSAYKLPIADVVDGKLVAIPKGVFAAAAAIQGARSPTKITDAERRGAIRHLERYYAKMDMESPFDRKERQFFGVEEVKGITVREIEGALHESGMFSKGAATILAGQMARVTEPDETRYDSTAVSSILQDLRDARRNLG